MAWIAETDRFSIGDLSEHVRDAGGRLVLVRRLVREGLLTAVLGGAPEAEPR
jgi:hypothetical protein